MIERLFGWLFRPFNRFFKRSSERYQGAVSRTLSRRGAVFAVYALLLVGTGLMFQAVPRGFIPTQDKLFLIAGVKLPEGASLERTDAVLQQVVDDRDERRRRRPRRGHSRPESVAVHQHAELRRRPSSS